MKIHNNNNENSMRFVLQHFLQSKRQIRAYLFIFNVHNNDSILLYRNAASSTLPAQINIAGH